MTNHIILETMSYQRQDNGVVFIAIDVKDRSINVLTPQMHKDFGLIAEHLAQDDKAKGAVIYSVKSGFMAGGDLNRIVRYYDQGRTALEAYEQSQIYSNSLRKLETCGKPVAVAMNGTALGGGLELALACHYRVIIDNPKLLLGLPEVSLGLLPAGGGTQRLPRLIGIEKAADLILTGRYIHPEEALELGIVDAITTQDTFLETAEDWILKNGSSIQPWDQRGYKIPGGAGLNQIPISQLFQKLTLQVVINFQYNYPAPIAALRCIFNGTTVLDMKEALHIETREFSALTRDPVARNMIRTLFLNKGAADKQIKKDNISPNILKTVGLIGDMSYKTLLEAACAKSGVALLTQDMDEQMDMLIIAGADQQQLLSEKTPHSISADRIVGLFISGDIHKAKAVEIIQGNDTSEDIISHIKTLCHNMHKTPTLQKLDIKPFSQKLIDSYNEEGNRLAAKKINPTLIQNSALATGMPKGPVISNPKKLPNAFTMDSNDIKNYLLCSQAFTAASAVEDNLIDPINADLISILINGFPSYTGGVISFIDTMGLDNFIKISKKLYSSNNIHNGTLQWLRDKAEKQEQFYPPMA